MAFGCQQHVRESAEDVGPDRLAFVGAGHALDLVGRNAEMVGPEPDQPLGKSDLGAQRRFDAHPGLFEIDLPPGIGDGFGGGLCRHRLGVLLATLRHHGGCVRHLLFCRFLLGAARHDGLGLPPGVGIGNDTVCLGARRQRRCRDKAGRPPLQFGDQRPARVGRNGCDRTRSWPHPEPVEGQRRFGLSRKAHAMLRDTPGWGTARSPGGWRQLDNYVP